jgi:site-specific recombinase XerD
MEIPRLLEAFIHHLRSEQVSESTVRVYASHVSMYLQNLAIHDNDPAAATRDSIGRYLQWTRARGRSSATIALQQTAIKRFHGFFASQAPTMGPNPLERRFRLRPGRKLPRWLSEDGIRTLIESVAGADALDVRDRALIELLYSTGLRSAEILGLTLAGVSQRARTLRITGKGSVDAIVPFGEHAHEWLARYLQLARPQLLGRESHDRLWVNCFGGPLRYAGLHRMVRERGKAAGLDRVTPHMLRHSFATHLMERGASLRVIQEAMRHASIRSTQIYTHIDTARLADEIRRYHPRG